MTAPAVWGQVVDALERIGTDVLFGIPSDDLGILAALQHRPLRLVVTKDQRNAVFMAAGHALLRGRPGVAVVGKGPALTNAITGLLEASALGAPLILIALGTARDRVGAAAFQEANQLRLVAPVTKWAYRVEHIDRLAWALEKAAFLALNDGPGPVYLEIPEDLANETPSAPRNVVSPTVLRSAPAADELDAVATLLREARRPVLLLGGGTLNTGAARVDAIALAERLGAVVFTTASGRGAIDERHALFGGLAGLYTPVALREAWHEADLFVVLGSRLEETATLLLDEGAGGRPVVQVNVRNDHFSFAYPGPRLLGDAALAARHWLASPALPHRKDNADWRTRVASLKARGFHDRDALLEGLRRSPGVHVAQVLSGLERVLPDDAVLVQENGLLDMWSYFHPHFTLKPGQRSIVPSDQTSLGFGVAAAIGVKAAAPHRAVVAFVGDGAFNIAKADLLTSVENDMPVTYVILNNASFGWLEHQWRHHGFDRPAFAFEQEAPPVHPRLTTLRIDTADQVDAVLAAALRSNADGRTALVDVRITTLTPAPGVDDFHA